MDRLPRPELPPGPHQDLVEALHALHHRSGWPSLRTLARAAGCSHTTVSTVFSAPRLPSWGVLELVVEAMDGEVAEFHRLWLAASEPSGQVTAAAGIAGRRSELAAVRRHLERGAGMLLVIGEAGIGKSRLVDAAADAATGTFVARGACLPLSSQVPLLPVSDVLRAVLEVDRGRRLAQALADCPPYVGASLRRLLPELDELVPVVDEPDDEWWRQRMFSAVGAVLRELASVSPVALLVEDLHWADATTLDLLEHLLSRSSPRLVATYRREDPLTPGPTREWLARVRRLPAVTTLGLGPLSRAESAVQVELLGVSATPAQLDRIHRRSAGLPLFTEHLAEHVALQPTGRDELPWPLADLLDERLADVDDDEWVVCRALGIADRPLSDEQLRAATALSSRRLTTALHLLEGRHLVVTAGEHDVRLRHPLLAEAVRRRVVAGEATAVHRRLARALALAPERSAAEVAEHWRCAGDRQEELVWRIRAAQEAGSRFAARHEADQWRRALELWPEGSEHAGEPAVRRSDARLAAIDALAHIDWPAAATLADEALGSLEDPGDPTAAALYERAGAIRGTLGDPAAGLELVDRALEILEVERHPAERARALLDRAYLLDGLDRHPEAGAARDLAARLSAGRDPVVHRAALASRGTDDTRGSEPEQVLENVRAAARVETGRPDPGGDVFLALMHTHVLLTACRSADEVIAAGRPGLEVAAAWGIDDFRTSVLLANMSEALRHAGRVPEAVELIDPVTEGPPVLHQWPTYSERGRLDLLRGRGEQASRLLDAVAEMFVIDLANRVSCAQDAPTADLWCGRPQRAYDRLTAVLRDVVAVEDSGADVAGLLVLAARAAADLVEDPDTAGRRRAGLVDELDRLVAGAPADPFAPASWRGDRAALRATWHAERGRLAGTPSLHRWVAAATAWGRIDHPHASSYCRWRAVPVALAGGQATTAVRLLRRAERDARCHLPLLEAIHRMALAPVRS
ncbi:MAG TPA: AAA family ATPase [Nocardioides sp.]|nr:AAA family ATPase [Nocardioides sp.]